MARGAVGRAGRGGRGGKTCPIYAPLPDLMLVLPFSSPPPARGWLPPSLCGCETDRPSSLLSAPLLRGAGKGRSREPPGEPSESHEQLPPEPGTEQVQQTLQPLTPQVRSSPKRGWKALGGALGANPWPERSDGPPGARARGASAKGCMLARAKVDPKVDGGARRLRRGSSEWAETPEKKLQGLGWGSRNASTREVQDLDGNAKTRGFCGPRIWGAPMNPAGTRCGL